MINTNAYVNNTRIISRNAFMKRKSSDVIEQLDGSLLTSKRLLDTGARLIERVEYVDLLPRNQLSEIKNVGHLAYESHATPSNILDEMMFSIVIDSRRNFKINVDAIVNDCPSNVTELPSSLLEHLAECEIIGSEYKAKFLIWAWNNKINLYMFADDKTALYLRANTTRDLITVWDDGQSLYCFESEDSELQTILSGGVHRSVCLNDGRYLPQHENYVGHPMTVFACYNYVTMRATTSLSAIKRYMARSDISKTMTSGLQWYRTKDGERPHEIYDYLTRETDFETRSETAKKDVVIDVVKHETGQHVNQRISVDRRIKGTKIWRLCGDLGPSIESVVNAENLPRDICMPKEYRHFTFLELTHAVINKGECTLMVLGMIKRSTCEMTHVCVIPIYPVYLDQRVLTKYIYALKQNGPDHSLVHEAIVGPNNYDVDILTLLNKYRASSDDDDLTEKLLWATLHTFDELKTRSATLVPEICSYSRPSRLQVLNEMYALRVIVDFTPDEEGRILDYLMYMTAKYEFLVGDIGHLIFLTTYYKRGTKYAWYLGIPPWVRHSLMRRVCSSHLASMSDKIQCNGCTNGKILGGYDYLVMPCGTVTHMGDPTLHWHKCGHTF
nr:hypothetical protein [Clanis bilineata cypovirus]